MRIAIASDHRGYHAKRRLVPAIDPAQHEILDFGCDTPEACDYPDFAALVGRAVASGKADIGVLLDGSGIGMTVAANKVCGVRAALAHDEVSARRAREHNHCNVLCIASDLLTEEQIRKIVHAFMSTGFGTGRHVRRVRKIEALEQERRGPASVQRALTEAGAEEAERLTTVNQRPAQPVAVGDGWLPESSPPGSQRHR